MQIDNIPMVDIFCDPTFNCRGAIAPISVIDLATDIKDNGLQQPIVIQPYTESEKYKWRIIMGHRRYTAFKVNGTDSIPCQINTTADESRALILNLTENLHREDLTIIQEATALERLKLAGMSVIDVSRALHKSTTWVNVRYKLLELPKPIREAAAAGFITQSHILKLHTLKDPEKQLNAAADIKKAKIRGDRTPVIKRPNAKRNILKQKVRDRDDIFWMQDHIQGSVGNNFGTRCLAWAAGEISDFELFQDIKYIADTSDKKYVVPYEVVK